MQNRFPTLGSTDSSKIHFSITPDDDNDLSYVTRRIYVTVGGDVALRDIRGNDVTWTVPANFYIDGQFTRVLETGTDATGIIGQA